MLRVLETHETRYVLVLETGRKLSLLFLAIPARPLVDQKCQPPLATVHVSAGPVHEEHRVSCVQHTPRTLS